MLYSSKGLALVLSVSISLTTGLLLYLFEQPDIKFVAIGSLTTFCVSIVLIFFAMEALIFRELRNVKEMILPVEGGEPPPDVKTKSDSVQALIHEIASFAEAKQKEIEQLRRQEAFRKDFIADISHELKTPIFAAQGFVHTLLDGAVKEKAVRKRFLKKAAKSLDGLDMLVQDLLTLSQIETGQVTMHLENIDLYSLTEEVFDQLKKKSDKKEVTLKVKGPARKIMVYADGQRISQVMINLVSNAIKHSSPGGNIEVSFMVKKQSVITRVKDFGEGIPEEHIHRIFERFYRVDKSRSREKGGTGLGLAIVKHILEGHNSKPKVESIPGKGSTFSFKLPRLSSEERVHGTEDTDSKG